MYILILTFFLIRTGYFQYEFIGLRQQKCKDLKVDSNDFVKLFFGHFQHKPVLGNAGRVDGHRREDFERRFDVLYQVRHGT